MTLKTYLSRCYDFCRSNQQIMPFTCLHLCAAHIIKDFIRGLKNINVDKKKKHFAAKMFAILQNTTSLQQIQGIYQQICVLFLSEIESDETNEAFEHLQKLCKKMEHVENTEEEEEEGEEFEEKDQMNDEKTMEEMTIKEASPFTAWFADVKHEALQRLAKSSGDERNPYFCPKLIEIMENKFLSIYPLWSGLMLRYLTFDDGSFMSRDTNCNVENWFKYVKCDLKITRQRPAQFVVKLKNAVDERLAEQMFGGANKKKSRARKKDQPSTDANLEMKKEVWKKRQKRKSKYHTSTSRVNVCTSDEPILPKVMRWGGKVEGTCLSNTCTIDNGLTIMHLFYLQHADIQHSLDLQDTRVGKVLNSVMLMMTEGEFGTAKAMWAGLGEKSIDRNFFPVRNLFGDEYDFMFKFLEEDWKSQTLSVCSNNECANAREEGKEEQGCIGIGCEHDVKSTQQLIDIWLKRSTPCKRTFIDETGETINTTTCDGERTIKRKLLTTSPFLAVRVYEHCMFGRIDINDILQCITIYIQNERYTLAGITMYKGTHYCAVVRYKERYLWYDGLKGLSPMKQRFGQWFPSYIIFGKDV